MDKVLKALKGMGVAVGIAAAIAIPFEGEKLIAYLDPPGIPSICYGHTQDVKLGDKATHEECVVHLGQDMQQKEKAVNRLLKRKVSPYVKGALIDFAYNTGEGNLATSSILRKINAGDIAGGCKRIIACDTLPSGKKAGYGCGFSKGVEYNGLKRRRLEEYNTCMKGVPNE